MDISQFQMGKDVVFLKDDVKIEEIINQAVGDVKLEAEKKKIYLKTEIPENLPMIKADFNKLRMGIYNIVDNAVKYTSEGGITIKIEDLNDKILIKIKDTGAGIPKDYQKDMFNKTFERGEGAMKMFATGRGIGLFITSKIVAGHNGKIWAESEGDGKGSTFFIELPINSNKKD